ncbi:PAS domain-containing sensor histidine kinase [Bacillus massilinigeriensis]|uniref:PAS domain-containing sensor histidine kinase n=1 Tax=Bacillus mediterraneensis TaxID=1805474 RepID=UPI0008F82993|nr:PAS domain-containing sensor histidine kinase [Bacillus mediterraneensis]
MKKKPIIIFIVSSALWIVGSNYILENHIPENYIHLINHLKEAFYVLVAGLFFSFSLKKKEQLYASREDEKRLATLINSMFDFVTFKDGEGRWIEANQYGLELFQLQGIDYRGKKDSELGQFSKRYQEAFAGCEKTDEIAWKNGKVTHSEEMIPMSDGSMKTFETVKVPLYKSDGSREGLVIIGRDITERKEMHRMLKANQERYKSLFDYNPEIVYMIDLNGYITNLNPQFESVTGFHVDETIGKHVAQLVQGQCKQQILSALASVISNKEPNISEIQVLDKHNKPVLLHCTSVPIIVNGKIEGIIGYGKNITEIKRTEETLRRTEKLSVVGELSASVAHEIRNPLTSLKGFVQLLSTEDSSHQNYYNIMLGELERINHIVGELLMLAKPQQIEHKEADIQTILSDVTSLLKTEASLYNVELHFVFLDRKVVLECEPNQLKQLFINLIKNAIEASPNGGIVNVYVCDSGTGKVMVTVKDNGCGISKEMLGRIGEPFYSSKEKGTGLGLTVSFKIVEAHNGKIRFSSNPGEGTEVVVELPKNNANIQQAPREPCKSAP